MSLSNLNLMQHVFEKVIKQVDAEQLSDHSLKTAQRWIHGTPSSIAIQVDPYQSSNLFHSCSDRIGGLLFQAGVAVAAFVATYYFSKKLVSALDPTAEEKRKAHRQAAAILKRLKLKNALTAELDAYEMLMSANIINPNEIEVTWNSIGGLTEVIEELKKNVIIPFSHPQLFNYSGILQPPKGILLYGPPGCGKTMIAKALCKEAGASFINVQLSSLLDKYYGEPQKRAAALFSLARKLQPAIIFIDEIDSFLRSRSRDDHESTCMIKSEFMILWDGLTTDPCAKVIVLGATNRPHDVDPAIMRRMPLHFFVDLPDINARRQIMQLLLKNDNLDSSVNLEHIASKANGFSGSDLHELCRLAALNAMMRVVSSISDGDNEDEHCPSLSIIPVIQNEDFENAFQKLIVSKNSCTIFPVS